MKSRSAPLQEAALHDLAVASEDDVRALADRVATGSTIACIARAAERGRWLPRASSAPAWFERLSSLRLNATKQVQANARLSCIARLFVEQAHELGAAR